MKNELLEKIRTEPPTTRNLCSVSRMIYNYEISRYQFQFKISLTASPFRGLANGFVCTYTLNKQCRAQIIINVGNFVSASKQSDIVSWFYLYATIVHEFEHVSLMQQLCSYTSPDYKSLMAALSQHNNNGWINPQKIINKIVAVPKYTDSKSRYASFHELICTQTSFKRAYEMLDTLFEEEDRKIINKMMNSLDFICDHMEITYESADQPYNLFAKTILSVRQKLLQNPSRINQLKQLYYIFDENICLKSPLEIYLSTDSTNKEFHDALLIHLFLLFDMDWTSLFSANDSFFNYMSELANTYNKRCIFYLENIAQGEIFVSKEILQDNAAMWIKNAKRLNNLMRQFNMKRTEGGVVALF